MATKFKIPKGARISKETLALIQSAAFKSSVKKTADLVKKSKVDSGYFPEGNLGFKLVGFDVQMKQTKKKQNYRNWLLYFRVADHTRKDDGKPFTFFTTIFEETQEQKVKREKEGREQWNSGVGEMKLFMSTALDDADKGSVDSEDKWAEILRMILESDLVFSGRAWVKDRTREDGETVMDKHLRTFGLMDEDEDAAPSDEDEEEGDEDEEGEESEDEDEEDEDSDEESDDSEDEDEDEGDEEEADIEVGTTVKVDDPKRGELEVTITALDEDAGTFEGRYLLNGKKKKATFNVDAVTGIVNEDEEGDEDDED